MKLKLALRMTKPFWVPQRTFKGIVHFEINFFILKGIQDVGVFVSAVFYFFFIYFFPCLSVI